MLTDYIHSAMHRAEYDKLENGTYCGEVAELEGVWANAATLEDCRAELQSAVEDWIMFSLMNGFSILPLDGIVLAVSKVA
ncbi:MAG: type II toxin-antitoxin system HicB family antitoxin [Dehalococcoidia bacterium]